MTRNKMLNLAISKLGREFDGLDLTFHKMDTDNPSDVTSYWPGTDDEDILVCVFNGDEINEPFHRQDFFFINYAYRNSYHTVSYPAICSCVMSTTISGRMPSSFSCFALSAVSS